MDDSWIEENLERYRRNNIELAVALNDLKIELNSVQTQWLEQNRDFQEVYDENTTLKQNLAQKDAQLCAWKALILDLVVTNTKKYTDVMQKIGLGLVLTKKVGEESNANLTDTTIISNPETPEKCDITSISQNATRHDDPLECEEALTQPCSLYPSIEIVNNEDEAEFSEDSTVASCWPPKAESNSNEKKIEHRLDGATSTATDEHSKQYVSASPKTVLTKCQGIKNSKRESDGGLFKFSKLSIGNKRSDPKSPFDTKSPTLPQRGNIVSLPTSVRVRSTSLNKINEISSIKSADMLNQSIISPFKVRSSKSPLNSLTSNPNNDVDSISPIVQINSNISTAGTNDFISSRCTSKSALNSSNNKKIEAVSAISMWSFPGTSLTNKINGIDSTGQTPKSPLLNVTNRKNQSKNAVVNSRSTKNSSNKVIGKESDPGDSIVKGRPKRNAAPTDLREPLLKLKMSRKI